MAPALFPEYEIASSALLWECADLLIRARDPILARIPRSTVAHLPEKPTTAETSVGCQVTIKPVGLAFVLPIDDILHSSVDGFATMVSNGVDEALPEIMKEVFGCIDQICNKGGNVARGEGPINIDSMLDLLEKMDIQFDDQGEPSGLRLFMSPEAARVFAALAMTPEQEARHQSILERKRKDFDARRRIRKLDRRDK